MLHLFRVRIVGEVVDDDGVEISVWSHLQSKSDASSSIENDACHLVMIQLGPPEQHLRCVWNQGKMSNDVSEHDQVWLKTILLHHLNVIQHALRVLIFFQSLALHFYLLTLSTAKAPITSS